MSARMELNPSSLVVQYRKYAPDTNGSLKGARSVRQQDDDMSEHGRVRGSRTTHHESGAYGLNHSPSK